MRMDNIRQSDRWFEYLHFLGWKHETTTAGTKIALMLTVLGYVTKIQRPQNLSEEDLLEIEQICKKYKTIFIKIEPYSDEHTELLLKHGYAQSFYPFCPPSTMLIDLTLTEERLWENISHSGKYSINRAKREGSKIYIKPFPNEEEIKNIHNVLLETKKLKKFYVQPIADLIEKVRIYKDNCFYAEVRNSANELMGTKFFMGEGNSITFMLGGTTYAGRHGKWGYHLLWESILYFKKKGYTYMDLEGVDDPRFPKFTENWGGFTHFKNKFGGDIIRYPVPLIKYRALPLKLLSKMLTLPL